MPETKCPTIGCGKPIKTTMRFEPKIGPLGNLIGYVPTEVVNQDDLRRHLLDHHKPKNRSGGRLRRTI